MGHIADFLGKFSGIFERKKVLDEVERWVKEQGISIKLESVGWQKNTIWIKARGAEAAALFMKKGELVLLLKQKFPDTPVHDIKITA